MDGEGDPPTRSRLRQALLLLPWLVGGAAAGYLAARLPSSGFPWQLGAWHVLLVPVALYLSLLVHEAGHFVAGRLAGLRWHTVAVGPLRLTRRRSGMAVEWFRQRGPIGGLVVMFPPRQGIHAAGWVFYASGGPLANLLAALAALGFAAAFPASGWAGALLVLAAMSLVLGLVNLVPFTAGGISTDGRNILQMLRDPAGFAAGKVLMSLTTESLSGVRPRDWSPELVEQVEAMPDPVREIALARAYLLYLRALDHGDLDAARQRLAVVQDAFDHAPALLAPPIACAVSVHHALVEPAPEAAREWHARGAHGLGDATLSAMADLGLAVVEQRWADAASMARKAGKAMDEDADQGGIQPYRDILVRHTMRDGAGQAMPRR